MSNSEAARSRAEATFKRKDEQAREGAKAWAEYQAEREALLEKTLRLRALRLAKETAEAKASGSPAPSSPVALPRVAAAPRPEKQHRRPRRPASPSARKRKPAA